MCQKKMDTSFEYMLDKSGDTPTSYRRMFTFNTVEHLKHAVLHKNNRAKQ